MKTPRYIKQPDSYGCGPTAILNALKWSGWNAPAKVFYENLMRRCNCRDPEGNHEHSGTQVTDFDRVLREVGFKEFSVRYYSLPRLKTMEKALKDGHAFALKHRNHDGTSHFSFIIGKQGRKFITVNSFAEHSTVYACERKWLLFWFKRDPKNFKGHPQAWLLKKLR